MLKGQLEYDPRFGSESDFPSTRSDELVEISISFPSQRFGEENSQFQKRHEYMQAEADEHYRLLVDMQISDPLFDRMLLDNHNRKCKVVNALNESATWQKLAKIISPNAKI